MPIYIYTYIYALAYTFMYYINCLTCTIMPSRSAVILKSWVSWTSGSPGFAEEHHSSCLLAIYPVLLSGVPKRCSIPLGIDVCALLGL